VEQHSTNVHQWPEEITRELTTLPVRQYLIKMQFKALLVNLDGVVRQRPAGHDTIETSHRAAESLGIMGHVFTSHDKLQAFLGGQGMILPESRQKET